MHKTPPLILWGSSLEDGSILQASEDAAIPVVSRPTVSRHLVSKEAPPLQASAKESSPNSEAKRLSPSMAFGLIVSGKLGEAWNQAYSLSIPTWVYGPGSSLALQSPSGIVLGTNEISPSSCRALWGPSRFLLWHVRAESDLWTTELRFVDALWLDQPEARQLPLSELVALAQNIQKNWDIPVWVRASHPADQAFVTQSGCAGVVCTVSEWHLAQTSDAASAQTALP